MFHHIVREGKCREVGEREGENRSVGEDSSGRYARFKAAYIRKCFKTGEEPIPGPPGEAPAEAPAVLRRMPALARRLPAITELLLSYSCQP